MHAENESISIKAEQAAAYLFHLIVCSRFLLEFPSCPWDSNSHNLERDHTKAEQSATIISSITTRATKPRNKTSKRPNIR